MSQPTISKKIMAYWIDVVTCSVQGPNEFYAIMERQGHPYPPLLRLARHAPGGSLQVMSHGLVFPSRRDAEGRAKELKSMLRSDSHLQVLTGELSAALA